jgi:hypothetical protein
VDTYTVKVIGYDAADPAPDPDTRVAVAYGEVTGIGVTTGTAVNENMILKEITTGSLQGTGTFNYTLTDSSPTIASSMSLIGITSGATTTHNPGAGGAAITNKSGILTLDSGYYRMEISLTKANYKSSTIREIIHIWNGHETKYDKTLSLNSTLHTVTYHFNDARTTAASTDNFTHGDTFTVTNAAAADPKYSTNAAGTVFDTDRGFLGWFEDNGTWLKQWATDGSKTVIRPQPLYARWTTPTQSIILAVTIKFSGDPIEFELEDGDGSIDDLDSYTIDQENPPEITITISSDSIAELDTPTYQWYYDQGPLSGSTTDDSITVDFADFDLIGKHTFTVFVYEDGNLKWSSFVTFTVVAP